MSEYLEEGFEDWLRNLPIEFINDMYAMWKSNQLADSDTLASITGDDLTYVGPLNMSIPFNVEFREVVNFVRKPKRKRIKPITEEDIKKLNSILRDNGIEES